MPSDEGDALYDAAVAAGSRSTGPMVEIGSYCGRSTVWLGAAARAAGTVLFAVDHHRGSEENQAGWEHHDPTVVDPRTGQMDTLPIVPRDDPRRRAGRRRRSPSSASRRPSPGTGRTPLSFLFIDGGHGEEPARLDYEGWSPHVAIGGTLAIHDVFPDPADGGRPPYEQIYLPALRSGSFTEIGAVGSLRLLRRIRRRRVRQRVSRT